MGPAAGGCRHYPPARQTSPSRAHAALSTDRLGADCCAISAAAAARRPSRPSPSSGLSYTGVTSDRAAAAARRPSQPSPAAGSAIPACSRSDGAARRCAPSGAVQKYACFLSRLSARRSAGLFCVSGCPAGCPVRVPVRSPRTAESACPLSCFSRNADVMCGVWLRASYQVRFVACGACRSNSSAHYVRYRSPVINVVVAQHCSVDGFGYSLKGNVFAYRSPVLTTLLSN